MLEERGVRVQPPQADVFLTLTASGPLDVIKAAVAELAGKYPRSGPFIADGAEPVPAAARAVTTAEHPPATDPPPSQAAQQCAATTADRSRCKLPAMPGGVTCAIHARRTRVHEAASDAAGASERDTLMGEAGASEPGAAGGRADAERIAARQRSATPRPGVARELAAAHERDVVLGKAATAEPGAADGQVAARRVLDRLWMRPWPRPVKWLPMRPRPTSRSGGRISRIPPPPGWLRLRHPRGPELEDNYEAPMEPLCGILGPLSSGSGSPGTPRVVAQAASPVQGDRRAPEPGSGWAPATAVPVSAGQVPGAPAGSKPRSRSSYWKVAVVVLVMALVITGSLTLVLSGHFAQRDREASAHGSRIEARTSNLAAAWVVSQVSRGAVVSCDPVMCQALRARGLPASDLYSLGPDTTSPLPSEVIVATAAVRAQFGDLLSAVYAPAVIASFGSGQRRIDIRDVALHGTAAYWSVLHRDLLSRKAAGTELLRNGRIAASALARSQLTAGKVDSRLLTAIAVMASIHPVYLVAFHSFAPGATAGLPLRFVDVAETGSRSQAYRPITARFVRSMVGFRSAQRAPFQPARVQTVRLAGRPGCPPHRVCRTKPARTARPLIRETGSPTCTTACASPDTEHLMGRAEPAALDDDECA